MIVFFLDNKFRNDHPSDAHESSKVPNEKTKKGLPTNKNIPVRNIKAQIVNMTINDNAGFKNEYNVCNAIQIAFDVKPINLFNIKTAKNE